MRTLDRRQSLAFKYLLALCDVAALTIAFYLSYITRNWLFAWRGGVYVATYRHAILLVAIMPVVLAYFRHSYLYRDLAGRPSSEHLEALTRAWVIVVMAFIALSFFFRIQLFIEHRITVLLFLILGWVGLYIGRFVLVPRLARRPEVAPGLRRRAVIVAPMDAATRLADRLYGPATRVTQVLGYLDDAVPAREPPLPRLGPVGELGAVLRQRDVTEVFIDLPGTSWLALQELVDLTRGSRIGVRISLRHFGDLTDRGVLLPDVEDGMVYLNDSAFLALDRFLKSAVDIAGAGVGLLLLSPLFLVVAACIKLESPGPVFFRQRRTGRAGRSFDVIKFRSMRRNTEDHHRKAVAEFMRGDTGLVERPTGPGALLKATDTSQVTLIGAFLRRTSMDELPQLINVLKGEMSLVGPRPEPDYQAAMYKPWQRLRHRVRPGITGYWQVMGRSAVSHDDMVLMDVFYINNWSLSLDLRILMRTFFVVLTGKGAL
jgi:exopolysaccharide biosynthesis polyprenyl glycosylphosphotransferase